MYDVDQANVDHFFFYRFKNDAVVDHSYTTSGRESRNVHTFVASSTDNNAKFKCEARNEMSVETMTAQIVLSVYCKYFS